MPANLPPGGYPTAGKITGTIAALNGTIPSVTPFFYARPGKHTLSITGVFVGTFTLQRSMDGEVTWDAVADDAYPSGYTAPVERNFDVTAVEIAWRVICTAYTSGTATVTIY